MPEIDNDLPIEVQVNREKEVKARLIREFPLMFLEMLPPQEKFIRVKNRYGRTPKRRLAEMGNKIGKTEIGLAEDLAHSFGFRPWLPPDDPDYKIDIKVPNIGLIGCVTKIHSVSEKIEPALRRLVPKTCDAQFKPGSTGVLSVVTLNYDPYGKKCGSKIHLRSYDEVASTYEGIDFDWVHFDEPPPWDIFLAVERGKVVTNAPSWYTMTPLSEPWVFETLSTRAATVC